MIKSAKVPSAELQKYKEYSLIVIAVYVRNFVHEHSDFILQVGSSIIDISN